MDNWRLFVASSIVGMAIMLTLTIIKLELVQRQVENSHKMLVAWAKTWGMSEDAVKLALKTFISKTSND